MLEARTRYRASQRPSGGAETEARIAELFEAAGLGDRRSVTAVERACSSASSYIDVIDRVMDKGIVIEAWVRTRVGGIDLFTVEGRVIVASIDTSRRYGPVLKGYAPQN